MITINGKPRKLGWKRDSHDTRDYHLAVARKVALPSVVDLRALTPPVSDQGQIGSCHDKETEVLTKHGWSKFAELTGEEELASVNPATGDLIYEKPTNLIRFPYVGPMIRGHHRFLDFLVTPNHKMLVRKWNQPKGTLNDEFEFVEAGDLGWYSGLLSNVKRSDCGSSVFTVPGVDHKHKPQRSDRTFSMGDWLKFLGIFVAEGTLCPAKGYGIQLAASKEREKNFIKALLASMNIHALELDDRFAINNRQIFEMLCHLGYLGTHAPFKRVPSFVFEQSSEMIAEFLLGHFMGDGSMGGVRGHYTSSCELAEDLQLLAFLSGVESYIGVRPARQSMTANGRMIIGRYPEYRVSICEKRSSSIDRKKHISIETYAGEVFCAEVPTYHTLVTRRNGRILVSGNCVANASCEAMEYLERKGAKDTLYSRLYLYARTRQFESTPLTEDSGSEIRDAVKILATCGVCLESTWPYDPPEQRFSIDPPGNCDAEATQHKALFYYRCVDLYTIRSSLAQGFPVVFGFDVPESMMNNEVARSGEVACVTGEQSAGGHAVLAVGYDDAKVIGGKLGALLVQNSWGTGWGLNGFFWLSYEFFHQGLASDFWTVRRASV